MIELLLPNIIRFVGLILIQVLVVSNLPLGYYVNPYIYPLILLALPFQIPHWLLMFIGFVTGLTVDIFLNTMGMHAAACVLICFLRPYAVQILTPRGGYDVDDEPKIASLGYTWFLSYVAILIVIHHVAYFYIEIFSFTSFFMILGKALLSSIVSIILIVLLALIFSPGKSK